MAPELCRYEAADTIHPHGEHVIGPEPLGSEHNCAQQVENARICKMVAVSVACRTHTQSTTHSLTQRHRRFEAARLRHCSGRRVRYEACIDFSGGSDPCGLRRVQVPDAIGDRLWILARWRHGAMAMQPIYRGDHVSCVGAGACSDCDRVFQPQPVFEAAQVHRLRTTLRLHLELPGVLTHAFAEANGLPGSTWVLHPKGRQP